MLHAVMERTGAGVRKPGEMEEPKTWNAEGARCGKKTRPNAKPQTQDFRGRGKGGAGMAHMVPPKKCARKAWGIWRQWYATKNRPMKGRSGFQRVSNPP